MFLKNLTLSWLVVRKTSLTLLSYNICWIDFSNAFWNIQSDFVLVLHTAIDQSKF